MSRKIIRCSLNHSSLRSAIQQLEAYQKDIQRKNQIFVDKLAQEGIQVIQTTMESIPSEEKGSYYSCTSVVQRMPDKVVRTRSGNFEKAQFV